jgi:hypothetical protein
MAVHTKYNERQFNPANDDASFAVAGAANASNDDYFESTQDRKSGPQNLWRALSKGFDVQVRQALREKKVAIAYASALAVVLLGWSYLLGRALLSYCIEWARS